MTIVLPFNATREQIRRARSTREWKNISTTVIHEEPTCQLRIPGICTVRSTTADHIIPVSVRPDLMMIRTNCQGACKPCNDWRRDMPMVELRARIANGTIQTHKRTPQRARRHIQARRQTPQAASAFFNTSNPLQHNTTGARNTLQHNTSHGANPQPRQKLQTRCNTTHSGPRQKGGHPVF